MTDDEHSEDALMSVSIRVIICVLMGGAFMVTQGNKVISKN